MPLALLLIAAEPVAVVEDATVAMAAHRRRVVGYRPLRAFLGVACVLAIGCRPDSIPDLRLPQCRGPLSAARSFDAFITLRDDSRGRNLYAWGAWRAEECTHPDDATIELAGERVPLSDGFFEFDLDEFPEEGDIVMTLEGGGETVSMRILGGFDAGRYEVTSTLPAPFDENLVLEYRPSDELIGLTALSIASEQEYVSGGYTSYGVPAEGDPSRIEVGLAGIGSSIDEADAVRFFPTVEVALPIACDFALCRIEFSTMRSVLVPLAR